MFALCDCDSFFASCERVFRPDLYGKPVVVLSNNDGCIVALTKEAKAVGLKRGIPLFQARDIIEKNNVYVFSSNYELYGDISARVMQLLADEHGDIDVYSIDEAYFNIDGIKPEELKSRLEQLRKKIYKGIGVPVSIGVGQTRTLAKVASHFAKKVPGYHGVCIIDTEEKRKKALQLFPVGDVWGIGRRLSKITDYYGITTAYSFADKPEAWIRNHFKMPGVRTWKELRGIPCKEIDDLPEKQSICTSRSFGKMVTDFEQLSESIANFTSSCARKLRKQGSVAGNITVFVLTNRHREDLEQYANSRTIPLPVPTASTLELIQYALIALNSIYESGYQYKKSGVIVSDISKSEGVQQNLFDNVDHTKYQRLTKAIDKVNSMYGTDAVKVALQGNGHRDWNLKREYKSPCYTTNIKDVLIVKADK